MSRQPKNAPMTLIELDKYTESAVSYGGRGQTVEANKEIISALTGKAAVMLAASRDESLRFPLSDLDRVNQTATAYLSSCARSGTLPSVTGLAAAAGRTRDALYRYARDHKEFSEWLQNYSDLCGEVTAQAAMLGAAAAVPTIFTLKARHGWREVTAIEINQAGRYDNASPEEIAERYGYNLPDFQITGTEQQE